ncbi:hypothetical protein D3C72_1586750 [compost metagenome]
MAGDGHADRKISRRRRDDHGAVRLHAHFLPAPLELPRWNRAAEEFPQQAGVLQQVARMHGHAALRQVGWRSRHREALRARADGDGDHVLLQPLAIADARVAATGDDIDKIIIDHQLDPDLGIGAQELVDHGLQEEARRVDRHVQAQGAARAVAQVVQHVERAAHFIERRAQARQQQCTGRRWRHAARRAFQQADAQLLLQPPQRLAHGGRGLPAGARGLAKTPVPGHQGKGGQIGHGRAVCMHGKSFHCA